MDFCLGPSQTRVPSAELSPPVARIGIDGFGGSWATVVEGRSRSRFSLSTPVAHGLLSVPQTVGEVVILYISGNLSRQSFLVEE